MKEFKGSEDELKETSPFFYTAFIAGSIKNILAREYGTTIFVFRKPKININERLKVEIEKKQNYH